MRACTRIIWLLMNSQETCKYVCLLWPVLLLWAMYCLTEWVREQVAVVVNSTDKSGGDDESGLSSDWPDDQR